MRKLSVQTGIAIILPLLLTACASAPARNAVALPATETKQPHEIREILRFKKAYVKNFKAEDDWFHYIR